MGTGPVSAVWGDDGEEVPSALLKEVPLCGIQSVKPHFQVVAMLEVEDVSVQLPAPGELPAMSPHCAGLLALRSCRAK